MSWQPHLTVATVIEQDSRFLLVQEYSDNQLVINQPAGHLEANETLEQAAIRETYEETGWRIKLTGLLGFALYTAPSNNVTYYRTTFIGQTLSHDSLQPLDPDIHSTLWLSYEEMLASSDRMRSHLVIKACQQYLAGHHYPLSIDYS